MNSKLSPASFTECAMLLLGCCFLFAETALGQTENTSKAEKTYLVIDISCGTTVQKYPWRFSTVPPDLNNDICRTTELWLKRIPAGTFMMGSPETELGRREKEALHKVTLTKSFYIGVFELTGRQWELVTGKTIGVFFREGVRPADCIIYDQVRGTDRTRGGGWPECGHAVDSDSFLGKLRARTGLLLDLPTEAQWEYACRAGTVTALNTGNDITDVTKCSNMAEAGRYSYNGGMKAQEGTPPQDYYGSAKAGSYKPNAWGLYDMHGNVWELCLDWYDGNPRTKEETDPVGPQSGERRQLRGGAFSHHATHCRSAFRDANVRPGNCAYGSGSGIRLVWLSEEKQPDLPEVKK